MKVNFYLGSLLFVTCLLCSRVTAIDEVELKTPPWAKESGNIQLKGNVREDIARVKPQTGIGIIGLKFIHQTGYPSYVEEVYPNSPASRAGLRKKDLIFAIDGVRTNYLNSDSVYGLLSGEPGTKVRIFITRGSAMFNVELTREDLAGFPPDIQNRYLSGPITVPINIKDFLQYH